MRSIAELVAPKTMPDKPSMHSFNSFLARVTAIFAALAESRGSMPMAER